MCAESCQPDIRGEVDSTSGAGCMGMGSGAFEAFGSVDPWGGAAAGNLVLGSSTDVRV